MGRFVSADWSGTPQGVPYADLESPQTLNLYAYVQNSPLRNRDLDGHGACEAAAGGGTNAWLACKGVKPTIQSSDNAVAIGGLPVTTGNATGERVLGALKGAASLVLGAGNWLAGSPKDSVASGLIPKLAPNTPDEKFGGQVFGILSLLFGGGAGEYAKLTKALASEEQVAEILGGGAEIIAGAGSRVKLRDAQRLAAMYGGLEEDWAKPQSNN
jgi:hypothetical protein